MGETITERTDKQTSELEDFRQLIKECGNSVAVNEITVECGICQKKYKVEADRSIASKVSYFRRKHFDACTGKSNCKSICEKENNQMKSAIASWLTRPSKQDETTANAMSDDSDIDTDLIVTPSDGINLITDDISRDPDIDVSNALTFVDDENTNSTIQASDCEQVHDLESLDSDLNLSDDCESSDNDSETQFCPINITQADPLCIELNELISNGTISRNSIFYKHNYDVVHRFFEPRHPYDLDVLEFHNSIEYLGGRKTANFLRGPMYHGQGSGTPNDITKHRMNLGGPHRSARQSAKAGYTTSSGVIGSLLLTFSLLLQKTDGIQPFIENKTIKVYPVSMAIDGTALKAAFEVDERTKKVVGCVDDYDIAYVKNNPNPSPDELKSKIVTEAVVFYLISICNKLSMPIAVYYLSKSGKTGIFMKELFLNSIMKCQICFNCLKGLQTQDGVIKEFGCCISVCQRCIQNGAVCEQCHKDGQISIQPSLRACTKCVESGKLCTKCSVFIITTDCESGNKAALQSIQQEIKEGTASPSISELSVLPDCVHVGKSVKCSFANWYLLLGNERANLSIIHTLRNDCNPDVKKKMRKLLTVDCVRNKDRMDVASVIKLSSNELLNVLKEVGMVVHNLIPDRFRPTEDNKPGMYPHPIAVDCDGLGNFVFLNYDPMTKTTKLVKARLHNPVQVKIIKNDLKDCRSVVLESGICYVCQRDLNVLVFGIGKDIGIQLKSHRSKVSLTTLAREFGLNLDGTANTIRERIQQHINNTKLTRPSKDVLNGSDIVRPSVLATAGDDLMLCSSDVFKSLYEMAISKDGVGLVCQTTKKLDYPVGVHSVLCMCYSHGLLYISWKGRSAESGGLISINLESLSIIHIFENQSNICSEISSVSIYKNGLVFGDIGERKLKCFSRDGVMSVIAGSGLDGCSTGSAELSSFGQIMGIAVEFGTNIYVTDAKYGEIKLVTTVSETERFLFHLQKIYAAFSIHEKGASVHHYNPNESLQMVQQSVQYFLQLVANVKRIGNIEKHTNGSEGTISKQTMDSLVMMEDQLIRFCQVLSSNPLYLADMSSCLTTVVENLHALSHVKQSLPTKLQYSRDFGIIFRESVKRITQWAAHYYTNETSYYPVPDTIMHLQNIPSLDRPTTQFASKIELSLLHTWANTHGKCVRQRTVRLETTAYKCGTLPLNMYESNKTTPGTSITFKDDDANISDQYSSESDDDNDKDDEQSGIDMQTQNTFSRSKTSSCTQINFKDGDANISDQYSSESDDDNDKDDEQSGVDFQTQNTFYHTSRDLETITNRTVSRSGRTLRISSRLADYL
ncbi:uncharacterized protein LOC134695518 [Mytilus trossulus]|uniref:uncharacterized protein LOC134695518 n=1 Tax=Mytilus trossulus TaxID=6551 RepID=UPI0030051ED5